MYVALALTSAVLWGAWHFGIGMFGRRISVYSVILVSGSSALATYVLVGLLNGDLVFDRADVLAGVLGGCLNLTGTTMSLKAVSRGKLGVVGGLGELYVLIPLAYSLVIGEALSPLAAAGIVILMAGLLLFIRPWGRGGSDGGGSGGVGAGVIAMVLTSAAMWGAAIIVLDVGSRANLYGSLAMSQAPQVIAMLAIVGARHTFHELTRRNIGPLIASGAALGLGSVAFYAAADEGDVGVVTIISSLSPIVTAMLALIILRERLTRLESVALVVVLAGTALVIA